MGHSKEEIFVTHLGRMQLYPKPCKTDLAPDYSPNLIACCSLKVHNSQYMPIATAGSSENCGHKRLGSKHTIYDILFVTALCSLDPYSKRVLWNFCDYVLVMCS